MSLSGDKIDINCGAYDMRINNELIHGMTSLHVSAAIDAVETVERCVQLGADLNARTGHPSAPFGSAKRFKRYTALHIAVIAGSRAATKRLIELKADVEAVDHYNRRPIEVSLDDPFVTDLLLRSGAEHNGRHFDKFPLIFRAIERNSEELVILLARNQTRSVYYADQSPIEYAMTAFPECVPILIGFEKQLHFPNPLTGETALHLAIRKRNYSWIELLCERGCDPNMSDLYGNRSLHIAVQSDCNSQILLQLLRFGANPNHKNCINLIPICYAVERGNVSATEVLLRYGSRLSPQLLEVHKSIGCKQYKTALLLLNQYKSVPKDITFNGEPMVWFFVKQCVGDQTSELKDLTQTMQTLIDMTDESVLNSIDPLWGTILHFLIYAMVCVPNDSYKHIFKVVINSDKCDLNKVFEPKDTFTAKGEKVVAARIMANSNALSFALQMLECHEFAEELIRSGADVGAIDWEHIFFAPTNVKAFKMIVLSGQTLPNNFQEYANPKDDMSVPPEELDIYCTQFDRFIQWLNKKQSNPLSLQECSRVAIRRSLGAKGCRLFEANGPKIFGDEYKTLHKELCLYLQFNSMEDFFSRWN